ncbi:F0F1 ATP synthase subunit B [Natronospirillum operosum]|uniref:ATP synthase subunit b n=1 Tax=Natronospirillum operosum TaxID=2759953 RepID=A0A4Z0W385_9GAMM|nr:F0F1 ATP synthase subunit B [Natronospirillum operosum]TGG91469.1 F0F1 ATP synthase subunit B [Natronospirillum operosum]
MNFNLTFIGQIITFGVFVWFCARFVWPPLMQAMQERQKKIADGLNAADRAAKDLELAQDNAAEKLREAKEQAASIVEQANRRASKIVEEAKADARAEGDRLRKATQEEIEHERNQAREALRAQVAVLALAGAEKVVDASVDEKVHNEMLQKLASEL